MSKNGQQKVSIETLTVDAMRKLLENQYNPRPPSSTHINRLAKLMRQDRWAVNGSAIVVDDRGRLVDGQHRLHAAILVDMPLTTIVVRGVDDGLFEIDTGKRRSMADLLRGRGWAHPTGVAGAVRILYARSIGEDPFTGFSGSVKIGSEHQVPPPSNSELMNHLGKLKRRTLEWAASTWGATKLIPLSVAVAAFYDFHEISAEDAEEVAKLLFTGLKMEEGSPLHVARRFFENYGQFGTRADRRAAYGVLLKMWNAYIGGDTKLRQLMFRTTEDYPELDGKK